MSKKKRQHYVPQFVLRQFSADGRRIDLCVLSDGRHVRDAPLSRQCYENYFYGVDPELEERFGGLETKVSNLLAADSEGTLIGPDDEEMLDELSDSDDRLVVAFAHLQRMRTLGAALTVAGMTASMRDYVLREVPDADRSQLELETSPQLLAVRSGAATLPYVEDLAVRYLINRTRGRFIVGDHPIALYNQWAENHPKFRRSIYSTKGLATKGLQWFYPMSPSLCVAIYDPTTYEYGSPTRRRCGVGQRDVGLLNLLQVLHAQSCVYIARDGASLAQVSEWLRIRAEHPVLGRPSLEEATLIGASGDESDLLRMRTPDARIGARFSFVRVVDSNRYEDHHPVILPFRSTRLQALRDRDWPADRGRRFDIPRLG